MNREASGNIYNSLARNDDIMVTNPQANVGCNKGHPLNENKQLMYYILNVMPLDEFIFGGS